MTARRLLSPGAQERMRQVRVYLLKNPGATTAVIADAMAMAESSMYRYLADMQATGKIRQLAQAKKGTRTQWVAVQNLCDPIGPAKPGLDVDGKPDQRVAPAVDLGAKRDPLIAALFGQAKQQHEVRP